MPTRSQHAYRRTTPRSPTPSPMGNVPLHVDAGYGRLYVTGARAHELHAIAGCAHNIDTNSYEMSLTMETLRRIRATLNLTREQMGSYCTDTVLRWGRAAAAADRQVKEVHEKLDAGFRVEAPWRDVTGHPITGLYRPPHEHQTVMTTAACLMDGWAILGGMGTGKTRAALEAFQFKVRNNELDILFVICPNRVKGGGNRATPMWTPLLRANRLDGTVAERKAEVIRAQRQRGTVFIINYEVLAKMRDTIIQVCANRRVGIVFDEGHRIRTPAATVTKAAMKIATHCKWHGIMTGSLVLDGLGAGVWAPWYVVDYGTTFGANYVQFRREFFIENTFSHEITPRRGAQDEIGLRLRRRGVRYRKEDCLDLPPQVWDSIDVEMTAEQRRAYQQMEEFLVSRLHDDTVATAATQLSMILRLSQITSGHVKTENGQIYRFDPNPKFVEMNEMLRDNIREQQTVVWAYYRPDIDMLLEKLRDLNPVCIRGGMSLRDSERAEQMFQDGSRRLFIGQQGAGGTGIDLYNGSLVFYFSQQYSLEQRQQSEDRTHRLGSEMHASVNYYDMMCRGTVDEIVTAALARKANVAEIIQDLRNHIGLGET